MQANTMHEPCQVNGTIKKLKETTSTSSL